VGENRCSVPQTIFVSRLFLGGSARDVTSPVIVGAAGKKKGGALACLLLPDIANKAGTHPLPLLPVGLAATERSRARTATAKHTGARRRRKRKVTNLNVYEFFCQSIRFHEHSPRILTIKTTKFWTRASPYSCLVAGRRFPRDILSRHAEKGGNEPSAGQYGSEKVKTLDQDNRATLPTAKIISLF